jgi:hypothetical protein
VRKTRSGFALAAVLAVTAWLPAQASARSLPTLLTGLRCEGRSCSKVLAIYKVRPHTVVLAEAFGGMLVVLHLNTGQGSWTS